MLLAKQNAEGMKIERKEGVGIMIDMVQGERVGSVRGRSWTMRPTEWTSTLGRYAPIACMLGQV